VPIGGHRNRVGRKLHAGVIPDDDSNIRRLRDHIFYRYAQCNSAGIVEGQQIKRSVASFHRYHGFLRARYQVKNRESVHLGCCRGEIRASNHYRRGL